MRISRKALLLAIPLFALPLIGQAADNDAGAANPGLHRDLGRDHRQLNRERRDRNQDRRQMRRDVRQGKPRAAARQRRDLRRDNRQMHRQRRDMRRDRRVMHRRMGRRG